MKPFSIIGGLLLIGWSLVSGAESSDQSRLVKMELDLSMRKAEGFGAKHPMIRRLESGIQMIEKRNPVVRDERYRQLLRKNRSRLEEEQIKRIDQGLGEQHPERVEIDAQLAEIRRKLAAGER